MDNILDEDWNDMKERFPVSRGTVDKGGRPVLYFDLEKWDVCGFMGMDISAFDIMGRYMFMLQEETAVEIRKMWAQGQMINKFRYLVNLGGLTKEKHGCKKFKNLFRLITKRPDEISAPKQDKAVFINVPTWFNNVYSVFPSRSQGVYGQDRSQWEPALLDIIDRDQFLEGILSDLAVKETSEGLLNWQHQEL